MMDGVTLTYSEHVCETKITLSEIKVYFSKAKVWHWRESSEGHLCAHSPLLGHRMCVGLILGLMCLE